MQIFLSIVNMSISSAILLLIVFLGRLLLSKTRTANYCYLLWMPYLFRLLIPYSLPSAFSMFNLFPSEFFAPDGLPLNLYGGSSQGIVQPLWGKTGFLCAGMIWAIGAGLVCMAMIGKYVSLRRQIKHCPQAEVPQLAECLQMAGIHKAIPAYYLSGISSPMVFGFWHIKILLPQSIHKNPQDNKYILLHEAMHIKRHDHWILLFSSVALALHWFNPLVWVARYWMAQDMEKACDQWVLCAIGESEQLAYAQALVNWARKKKSYISMSYATFGQRMVKERIKGVIDWKRLPLWAETILMVLIVLLFLLTVTSPIARANVSSSVSSFFVLSGERQPVEDGNIG